MRNNETGEFELVVGNKQLLSGFFIVVLLFAVAFAMGYVVGQNTQRPAKLASDGGAASSRRKHRGGFTSSACVAGARGGRAARAGSGRGHATSAGLARPSPPRNPPRRRSRRQATSPQPRRADTGTVASSELPRRYRTGR